GAAVGTVSDDEPPTRSGDWVSAGSGATTTEHATLSNERHYRLVGDTVEFRITFIGDDDEPTSRSLVEMHADGLEIVQRLPEDVEIAAGQTVEVFAKLRAIREGVVRWGYRHGTVRSTSGSDMQYVLEAGRLRSCGPDECGGAASIPTTTRGASDARER
ncbi:MAG: hypothetical protein JKY37_33750, partial [Nannocystaceae bacterium]|nr:hypothetical protein [Nannocystaceae bacterium]